MNTSAQDSIKKGQLAAGLLVPGDSQIEVQGVLNFETVPVLMKQAEGLLQNLSEAKFSFKGVDDSNSAGLALLLELKRFMNSKNKNIVFSDLPVQIRTIAHAYGMDAELDAYLGLQDSSI